MNWKKFTAFTISILLIICVEELVHACADGPDPYDEYPSFFFNNINSAPAFTPFYYTSLLTYYTEGYGWYDDVRDSTIGDMNEAEWYNYTHQSVKAADIDSFIYKASYTEINNVRNNELGKLRVGLSENTFVKWLLAHDDKQALSYLLYAKKCEPYAAEQDGHWDNNTSEWKLTPRDTAAMAGLVTEGLHQYKSANSDFFKWRYRYQILRMAMYSGHYQQTISLYDELIGNNNYNGIMYARCLGMKAGALYKMKNKTEAAYLYSLIFDASDEMKETALTSFNWALNGNAQSVLPLCKTDHERAVIAIMDALYETSGQEKEGLALMENAYKLDPNVNGLNVVMTREINKTEQRYLQTTFQSIPNAYYYQYFGAGDKRSMDSVAHSYSNYLAGLNGFALKLANDGKLSGKAFWHLSSAYIYFMQGNYAECKKHLDISKKEKMTPIERDVHDIVYALYIIHCNGKVTAKTEADLLPYLKWIETRSDSNKRFAKVYTDLLTSVLCTSYLQQGDTVKAIFCLSRTKSDKESNYISDYGFMDNAGTLLEAMTIDELHKVQAFAQSSAKTPYDNWLTTHTPYSFSVLRELEGTKYIREMQFDKAVTTLKDVSKENLDNVVLPDILINHIQDMQDWIPSDSTVTYNKLSFAMKMAELQQKLNANPKDGRAAYQFANGLYNMSYYGKAHHAFDYYRSSTDDHAYITTKERNKLPAYQQEYYDVKLAEKYYIQAYTSSTSPEVKARCLFMAAKCWQKSCPQANIKDPFYYDPYYSKDYYLNSLKNPYFNQLNNGYKKTRFFNEAYNTCSYLRDYVKTQ